MNNKKDLVLPSGSLQSAGEMSSNKKQVLLASKKDKPGATAGAAAAKRVLAWPGDALSEIGKWRREWPVRKDVEEGLQAEGLECAKSLMHRRTH